MKLDNATVLITGANRGIGLAFAREALARGARKVYAGARDPATVTLGGVEAVRLDVTRPDDVADAARRLGDVTLLINNAGIATMGGFLAEGSIDSARRSSRPTSSTAAPEPGVRSGAGVARRRRDSQRAVGRELDQLAVAGGLRLDQAAAWSLTNGCGTSCVPRVRRCWACTWASSTPS